MHPEFRYQHGRRDFLQLAAATTGFAAFGGVNFLAAAQGGASAGHSRRRLRAAFSNIGLQVTWCAQGKEAAEYWGRLFNVDVTWFDPELSAAKQLALVEEIASEKWDFVAIQAVEGALGTYRRAGTRQRLPISHRQVSRCRGPGDRSGGLGRRENSAAVGAVSQHVPEDRCRVLPQRRHGACRSRRHESAGAYRKLAAWTRCRRRSRRWSKAACTLRSEIPPVAFTAAPSSPASPLREGRIPGSRSRSASSSTAQSSRKRTRQGCCGWKSSS
jgi:hypothetical protein